MPVISRNILKGRKVISLKLPSFDAVYRDVRNMLHELDDSAYLRFFIEDRTHALRMSKITEYFKERKILPLYYRIAIGRIPDSPSFQNHVRAFLVCNLDKEEAESIYSDLQVVLKDPHVKRGDLKKKLGRLSQQILQQRSCSSGHA